MVVHGAGAVSQSGISADGLVEISLGTRDRGGERQSGSQARGDRGRIGAARAVGVRRVDAGGGEFLEAGAVVENVGGAAIEMAAFDQHGARSQSVDALGGAADIVEPADFAAGERGGFGNVGSDQRRERQQSAAQYGDRI